MTDLTPPAEKPIEVPQSSLPAETATVLRYVLATLGGIFVSRGWLADAELNAIVGIILICAPTVWGWIKTRSNHAKLLTVAEDRRVPDSVARVK